MYVIYKQDLDHDGNITKVSVVEVDSINKNAQKYAKLYNLQAFNKQVQFGVMEVGYENQRKNQKPATKKKVFGDVAQVLPPIEEFELPVLHQD
jgi:hypothetical protein